MASTHPHASFADEYRPLESPLLQNPYPFYARARAERPVFFSEALNAWIVTRYQDVKSILSRPELFSSANQLRPAREFAPEAVAILRTGYPRTQTSLLNSDGAEHKRLRAPLNRALSSGRINAMRSTITEIVQRLVDRFSDAGTADIVAALASPLPLEVILTLFGIPREKMEECKKWSDDFHALLFDDCSPERQVECARSTVAFQRYCAEVIEERRAAARDDVISMLIHGPQHDEQSLDTARLVAISMGLLVAGHETTTFLIANALLNLLSRRELWRLIGEEPQRIAGAVEEILRFDGSVRSMYRVTTREAVVGDVTAPPGVELLLLYNSANRDEEAFERADELDIDRSPNPHLGFGHGPHKCVGMHLGRIEAQIALEVLSRRFPSMRLASDSRRPYVRSLMLHGVTSLLVEWDEHA